MIEPAAAVRRVEEHVSDGFALTLRQVLRSREVPQAFKV